MIFRTTRKLAAKLGVKPFLSHTSHGNPLDDWTAHLLMASHWQYIIVVNSVTLYPFVIPGGKYRSASAFRDSFTDGLLVTLERDGLGLLPVHISIACKRPLSSAGLRIGGFWGRSMISFSMRKPISSRLA
jgi:hypothetical protein